MKVLYKILVTLALILSVSGCTNRTYTEVNSTPGPSATMNPTETTPAVAAASPKPGKSFVLKYSIVENEQHGQGAAMLTFKEKIEELSNGQITVQTYPSSSLYSQEGTTPAIISGELEMSHISAQFTSEYLPKAAMFTSTYMFKNYAHMRAVLDSEIGEQLAHEVSDAAGFTTLAFIYNGCRLFSTTTTEPITKPQDMKDQILRMPNSAAWIAAGESLGANVIPMAYADVYTALQTGTIMAQDSPLKGAYNSRFYEVIKQIILTNHIIDFNMLAISNVTWKQMSDEQKEWMYQAAQAAQVACDKTMLEDEVQLLDFMRDRGIMITQPDIDAFIEYSYNYYVDKGLTANWDMQIYNRIQDMAK